MPCVGRDVWARACSYCWQDAWWAPIISVRLRLSQQPTRNYPRCRPTGKPRPRRTMRIEAPWWSIYHDPGLDQLESEIDIKNQNLKQYEAAYRQALAVVAEARSGLFPKLMAGGTAGESRFIGTNTTETSGAGARASWGSRFVGQGPTSGRERQRRGAGERRGVGLDPSVRASRVGNGLLRAAV